MYKSEEEQLKNFKEIAEFQEKLININFGDQSYQTFEEELINSNLLNSKVTFRSVIVSIYTCFLCRPHLDLNYINLFIKIAQLSQNPFTSDDYVLSFSNHFFIYHLYKAGIVSIDSIHKRAYRSDIFFKYFYPEIKQNFPDSSLFDIQKSIGYTSYKSIKESIEPIHRSTYYHNFARSNNSNVSNDSDDLFKDEELVLKKFAELRSKGHNPDPAASAIFSDDVDKLQDLLSKTNTPIDLTLANSIFESCSYVNLVSSPPTLIEYAAFFGSINCFKFLYQNLAKLPERISSYAVAGGNYEIIHLCESKNARFDASCLNLSIRFFRPEITDYLEENYPIKKNISSAAKSIVFYNLGQLIDHKNVINEDPNAKDELGYSLLSLACLNGDLDIANYLVTTFSGRININEPNESKNTPLFLAAGSGHIEIVKYLSSIPEIDINAPNSGQYTALHNAAGRGHLNIVKYLCSLPNININFDCERNFRPIDNAVLLGNIEVISYLSSLPNIIIFKNSEYSTILENSVYSKRLDVVQLVFQLIENQKKNCNDTMAFKNFETHEKNALRCALNGGLKEIRLFLENKKIDS